LVNLVKPSLVERIQERDRGATMAHQKKPLQGGSSMGELLQPWHLVILAIIGLITLLIVLPPYWMIFKKAGYSPWLSLLTVLPLVKWIVLYAVAFSDWKARPSRPA
jgi:hypothetical protein